MTDRRALLLLLTTLLPAGPTSAATMVLDARLHHLRCDGPREWSDFPERPEGPNLSLRFQAERNEAECTLRLRQQDVKQTWRILLNGKELFRLPPDENDMVLVVPVPPGVLRT